MAYNNRFTRVEGLRGGGGPGGAHAHTHTPTPLHATPSSAPHCTPSEYLIPSGYPLCAPSGPACTCALPSMDLVVCLGDSLNLLEAEQSDDTILAAAEAEMSQVLTCLENIKCRVVYIPGNVRGCWRQGVCWCKHAWCGLVFE